MTIYPEEENPRDIYKLMRIVSVVIGPMLAVLYREITSGSFSARKFLTVEELVKVIQSASGAGPDAGTIVR